MLEINALGGLVIRQHGAILTDFAARKEEALLVYLACSGRPHRREVLADLFWDDRSQAQALSNLRVILSGLRQRLGPYLAITRQMVGLNPDASFRLDVAELEAALDNAETLWANTGRLNKAVAAHLEQALTLLQGDFLAGFSVRDSQGFDDWVRQQRERVHSRAVEALNRLVTSYQRDGDFSAAILHARRLLELDALQEETHRQLMELLAQTGQRSAAIAQYDICRRTLAEELAVEPAEETTALYERIRNGNLVSPPETRGHVHNIPPQLSLFVGREEELTQIRRALEGAACHLLTLVGPGGIGKTRLALQAASEVVNNFRHGVYIVSLLAVPSPDFLVSTIAEGLEFDFYSERDPLLQLLNYLHDKETLLVLDDFAHLLGAGDTLSKILAHAPGLKVLVTSHEPLNLQEEWVIRVSGMAFPVQHPTASPESYDALKLFEQSARRVQPDFRLTAENQADAIRICQLVEGLPLGIELAAAWTRIIPCSEIVGRVGRDLDFLATSLRNVPERHRSLRVVFEQSWQLLSDYERGVFMKLTVFRGGFGLEAAEQVAGASFAVLTALVDKSLVRAAPSGRFTLHELLSQFVRDKLLASGLMAQARDAHLAYFIGLAERLDPKPGKANPLLWLNHFELELDNWRAALDWCLETTDRVEGGLRLASALWRFWRTGGYADEGLGYLDQILSQAGPQASGTAYATALAGAAMLAVSQGDLAKAETLATDGLPMFRSLADERGAAIALNVLGTVARSRGSYSEAVMSYAESLTLARAVEDRWLIGLSLSNQGLVAFYQRDYEGAARLLEEALTIYQAMQSNSDTAFVLNLLGRVAQHQGNYVQAHRFCKLALELCWEQGNKWGIVIGLSTLSGVCKAQGEIERATRLLGAESVLRDAIQSALPPGIRTDHAGNLRDLRAKLDPVSFAAAWSEGGQ